jgi:hypothetical protein
MIVRPIQSRGVSSRFIPLKLAITVREKPSAGKESHCQAGLFS